MSDKKIETEPTEPVVDSTQESVAEVSPTDTELPVEKITPKEVTEPVEASTEEPDKSVEEGSITEEAIAETPETAITEESAEAKAVVETPVSEESTKVATETKAVAESTVSEESTEAKAVVETTVSEESTKVATEVVAETEAVAETTVSEESTETKAVAETPVTKSTEAVAKAVVETTVSEESTETKAVAETPVTKSTEAIAKAVVEATVSEESTEAKAVAETPEKTTADNKAKAKTRTKAKTRAKAKTKTTASPKKKKRRKKLTPEEEEAILALKKGQHMAGKVKNITEFGAFVDLGIAQDGLVHISQLSRQKVEKPEDMVTEGQEVDVWVKKVDKKRGRISLTMIRPVTLRFKDIAAEAELEGTITRLEPYGAFIDISSERDGLVHISEITHEYIKHPEDVLTVEEKVKIKVLKVDHKKRQVDLSIKALLPPPPPKEETASNKKSNSRRRSSKKPKEVVIEEVPMVTAMAVAFSSLKEEDGADNKGNRHAYNRAKEKKAMASILDRTLAVENSE